LVSARFDPHDMALRGKIGAYRLHATHDPRKTTQPARVAFLARFLDEVDPDRILPEAERQRRAIAARKAWMARLAYRSAKARSQRRQTTPPAIGHDSPSGGA
jgi:hypothetical protein